MSEYRLKTLCTEIFKRINNLNPSYVKDIFQLEVNNRPVRKQQQNNLIKVSARTATFGTKSLSLGPTIWNKLPEHIKCTENIIAFKQVIKLWDGEKCSCSVCNDT